MDEEIVFDAPEPGDYVTADYIMWFEYGGPYKVLLETHDPNDPSSPAQDWNELVKAHMDKERFWPNAWYIGERGESNLLSLENGGYA